MKNYPKVFVIVLNYNGKGYIRACLQSIYQSDYSNFEIVVVDNNSTDGSLEMAKELFGRTHFIRNQENIGFSAGINIGIRFALEKMADFVLLLNNDALLEKNTIFELIKASKNEKAPSLMSPIVYKGESNEIWFAGGDIHWFSMKTTHYCTLKSKTTPYPSSYLSGCALFVPKEIFKEIGLFDETFFLYYEDADFSLRAKKKFKLLIIPSAQVRHFEESNNSPKKIYWLVLSGMIFFKKNSSPLLYLWIAFYNMCRRIKNFIDRRNPENSIAYEVHQAYKDYAKHGKTS